MSLALVPNVLKDAAKWLLRRPWLAPFFGWLIARRLTPLNPDAPSGALRVLVFSDFRWRQDLAALANTGCVSLFAIDRELMFLINAFFSLRGREVHESYFLEEYPKELERRAEHSAFISRLAPALKRHGGFGCAVTAAIHYRQEHPWAEGLDRGGLPFVALHKEFTVIDRRQLRERVARYHETRQRFLGSHVCVSNAVGRQLFADGGVFPEEQTTVTGLLRMDHLLGPASPYRERPAQARRQVTLFSFGHLSGGLHAEERRSHYFTAHDHYGFVELFRDVHVGMAELALAHPDVDFVIKPKNIEDWWIREIEAIVEQVLGRSLASIPNCRVVETPAPELIRDSTAVIAFNSTVLLESRLLDRDTIFPVFAEAAGAHSENVLFPEFRDVFAIAESKQHLTTLVERSLAGERLNDSPPHRIEELCRTYIGYGDGRTAERVVKVLELVSAGQRPDGRLLLDSAA